MGRSVKWRVETAGGERLVRVQAATHGRRFRLFIDEKLFSENEAFEDLRDCAHTHEFDVNGTACLVTISGDGLTLTANGAEIEPLR